MHCLWFELNVRVLTIYRFFLFLAFLYHLTLTAYPEDTPKYLHRDHLAAQCKRIASTFDLNIWLGTTVKSTTQNATTKDWTIVLQTPNGERTVHAKHLVQATGVGSRFPYIPKLDNDETQYKGISIHSQYFKNGTLLAEKGVKVSHSLTLFLIRRGSRPLTIESLYAFKKTVAIIGSANTAFDVMQACYESGLATTMVQRNPTFILPTEYLDNPNGLGVYGVAPAEIADAVTGAGPVAVGGQLVYGLHQMLAAAES